MDKWSAEAWNVVGPWINGMASNTPDPNGRGPWFPTLEAVKDCLDSVDAAWRRIQPPG